MKSSCLTVFLLFFSVFSSHAASLQFSSEVPSHQKEMILADLKFLESMQFQPQMEDAEVKRIMELAAVNSNSFGQWLTARLQYGVQESFRMENAISISKERYSFENSNVKPIIENASTSAPTGTARTMATNIGGAIYYVGKSQNTLLEIKIPGVGKFAVKSPRVGIFQIGEGLFQPFLKKKGYSNEDSKSLPYRIERLSTLFHEGRHSDGNGTSLGFFHAVCPQGHAFQNLNACDRNLNGPYTIGALVTRTLLASCAQCSPAEREVLKLATLDSFSRVIKVTKITPNAPSREVRDTCELLLKTYKQLKQPIPKDVKELCTFPEAGTSLQEIPSTMWDARPEGRR